MRMRDVYESGTYISDTITDKEYLAKLITSFPHKLLRMKQDLERDTGASYTMSTTGSYNEKEGRMEFVTSFRKGGT